MSVDYPLVMDAFNNILAVLVTAGFFTFALLLTQFPGKGVRNWLIGVSVFHGGLILVLTFGHFRVGQTIALLSLLVFLILLTCRTLWAMARLKDAHEL